MKKLVLATLCILSLVGCSTTKKEAVIIEDKTDKTEIATPFHEATSLDEAEKDAGFSLNIPEEINGSTPYLYLVYDNDMSMIEVRYGTSENEVSYIRKNKGLVENISGDYNSYDETKTVTVNGNEITLKLHDDLAYLAEWNSGDYSYALKITDGLSEEAFLDVVSHID